MKAVPEVVIPDIVGTLRDLVHQVPRGRVTTYQALAEALGDVEATRFVTLFLAEEGAAGWPTHRVLHRSGAVGRPFGEDARSVVEKLRAEGVRVVGDRVDPLPRFFFADFRTDRPLAALQQEQRRIAPRALLTPLAPPARVAAVDVAYRGAEAVAALVLADARGEPQDFLIGRAPTRFPYVRTYLAYRELPACLAVLREARTKALRPDVLLVDGNGILHPRRAGIATHLGVLLDLPTVGVAKGHLLGDVNTEGMGLGEWRPVLLDREIVGGAIRTGRHCTLFVSPGHRADVRTAVDLVLELTRGDPWPPPLRLAHELATEAARA